MYDILDSGLARVGAVEKVSSDNHSIHWQSAGTLTLIAAATDGNLRELRNDRFVLIRDTFRQGDRLDGLYVICSVQHDDEKNEITVNGKTAPYLLHLRAMQERVLTDSTAGAALAGIVNENARGLPIQADFVSAGDPAVVRYPMENGAVNERCEDLMSYCGIGMEAVLGSGEIKLTYSPGRDLSAEASVPVLGMDSGRAWNTSLTVDDSDYYNVAVGRLAFTDSREEAFELGSTDTQGATRRELHIGEIAQKTGESEEEFRARAATQANATLAARLLRTTINADISPADYGRPYLVGDLVRVQVGPVTIKKRIIGATWLFDQSNDKISLTLGDQLNTVVAEIQEQEKANASKASSAAVRAGGAAKAIVGIKSDVKALIARVDGLVAGMDAYVLEKVFEDYKLAAANLFAALEDEDEAIISELSLQAKSIDGLQDASAALSSRVDAAEAGINLIATEDELKGLKDAKTTLYAEIPNKARAEISAYAWEDSDGKTHTVADILADVINLQGRVDVTGILSVENGGITSSGPVYAPLQTISSGALKSQDLYASRDFYYRDAKYEPIEITSTSGAVLALGFATVPPSEESSGGGQ